MNNIIRTLIAGVILIMGITPLSFQLQAQQAPLAEIGSYWNYTMSGFGKVGFYNYKVVKDTIITAEVYDTGETITVTASWIEKRNSASIGDFREENVYKGGFAAYREGNKSYVWENRQKKWFKWIDMDARPGDKWIVPELLENNNGVYDYVEVQFLDTLTIDGIEIPCIYLMPSCTSRYSLKKDFTSRLSMSGYFNIDYLGLTSIPEPHPNGYVYQGLVDANRNNIFICGKVNGQSIVTEWLEEYVKTFNSSYYEDGIIDCDSLKAPVLSTETQSQISYSLPKQKIVSAHKETTNNKKPEVATDLVEITSIPLVIHVVHNKDRADSKITYQQIQEMIEELNNAYSKTQPENVRDVFKPVIGNPHITFELAKEDEQGDPTEGIIYYETDVEYYSLIGSEDPKIKYSFKFNDDGSARNWNHNKYANIYIVNLGGVNDLYNVGGFVTNPPIDESSNTYRKWLAEGDTEFWTEWLKTEEGSWLDGLTIDWWYTFGSKEKPNPNATFKTAIHELGHYLGLRHPSIQIIQNPDGSIETFDDGFEDTPATHYTQSTDLPCNRDIYQCGNLVQTENYMDYALGCACMFTKEQAAFMRQFIHLVRPSFIYGRNSIEKNDLNKITIYPNPAQETLHINGKFISGELLDITGRKILSFNKDISFISVKEFRTGTYLIKLIKENNQTEVQRVLITN